MLEQGIYNKTYLRIYSNYTIGTDPNFITLNIEGHSTRYVIQFVSTISAKKNKLVVISSYLLETKSMKLCNRTEKLHFAIGNYFKIPYVANVY